MIDLTVQQTTLVSKRLLCGALAALAAHGAVLLVALHSEAPSKVPTLLLSEVDLDLEPPKMEPVPEPPKEEPKVEPEPVAPKPAAAAPKAPRAARAEPAAPPAAAAPLHTAQEQAKVDSEPVRFAVDAKGTAYGFGVVAQGGVNTGRAGGSGNTASAPATSNVGGSDRSALRNFAVPPRLEESDPCSGYFPAGAGVDFGTVTLRLVVGSKGEVRESIVLSEQPKQQGFGRAAVLCLSKKRFVPALNESGQPQAAEAPVAVRFRR